MKFIKVTCISGREQILNADAILNINIDDSDKTITNIFIRDREISCFEVKETPDEILEMLK